MRILGDQMQLACGHNAMHLLLTTLDLSLVMTLGMALFIVGVAPLCSILRCRPVPAATCSEAVNRGFSLRTHGMLTAHSCDHMRTSAMYNRNTIYKTFVQTAALTAVDNILSATSCRHCSRLGAVPACAINSCLCCTPCAAVAFRFCATLQAALKSNAGAIS